jgi:hypothetical protein
MAESITRCLPVALHGSGRPEHRRAGVARSLSLLEPGTVPLISGECASGDSTRFSGCSTGRRPASPLRTSGSPQRNWQRRGGCDAHTSRPCPRQSLLLSPSQAELRRSRYRSQGALRARAILFLLRLPLPPPAREHSHWPVPLAAEVPPVQRADRLPAGAARSCNELGGWSVDVDFLQSHSSHVAKCGVDISASYSAPKAI